MIQTLLPYRLQSLLQRNGTFNGWFAFNDWTTSNGSFNYCEVMIYNIHP